MRAKSVTTNLRLLVGVTWIVIFGIGSILPHPMSDKFNANHKCIMKVGQHSYQITYNGMLGCVADLIKFWKWRDVGIIIVQGLNEKARTIPRPKWNFDAVLRLLQVTPITRINIVHINAFEDHSKISHTLTKSFDFNRLTSFVVLARSKEPLAHFMNELNTCNIVEEGHVWIVGVQNQALSFADMKHLVANQTNSRRTQFVALSTHSKAIKNGIKDDNDHNDDEKPGSCRDVRIFDVFFREGSKFPIEVIQFGEWIHNRGLRMHEQLRDKQSKAGRSSSVRQRLRRRLVRGLVFEYEPYAFLKTNKQREYIYGYVPDIIRIMALHLNFKFEIDVSNETSAGTRIGNSNNYTGTVGVMYRKKTDVAVNVLSITQSRWDAVSYSSTIVYGVMGLWVQMPGKYVSPIAHVLPFSKYVWIVSILFAIVLITLLAMSRVSDPSFNDAHVQQRWRIKYWILSGEFLTTILAKAGSMSSKLLLGTLLLFTLLLFSQYSSVFMSYLTYSRSTLPFSNEQQLVTANAYRVTMIKNANYHDILKSSKSGLLSELWKKVARDREPLAINALSGLRALCKSPYLVFLIDARAAAYLAQKLPCPVKVIKTNHIKEFGHISTRKEFPYNKLFYKTLIRIKEYGIMSCLRERYFNLDFLKSDTTGEMLSLNLQHFVIPFLVLNCGLIVSVVVVVSEIVLNRFVTRRRRLTGTN